MKQTSYFSAVCAFKPSSNNLKELIGAWKKTKGGIENVVKGCDFKGGLITCIWAKEGADVSEEFQLS